MMCRPVTKGELCCGLHSFIVDKVRGLYEDLFCHSVRVAEIVQSLYWEEVLSVARRLGTEPERVLAVAYLHDVGKAHEAFQLSGSYSCHEFYSAAIARKIFTDIGDVLALTIVLHHHAMERFDRCENLKTFRPSGRFHELLVELGRRFGTVEEISRIEKWEIGEQDIKRVFSLLRRGGKLYADAIRLTGPLVIADYKASITRGNIGSFNMLICRESPEYCFSPFLPIPRDKSCKMTLRISLS